MSKPTSFSGVQPSGQPTLGNLIGVFQPFVAFQDSHQATFCIVDHHAITSRPNPEDLRTNTLGIFAYYLAMGLDPAKCTIFAQSHLPQHTELAWILNSFTQMGELERMTQYKDKSQRQSDNINVGLFDYPVLMAADILLHQVQHVPVGDDQLQHVELTRDIATRFNNLYGPTFTIPKAIIPQVGARVMDLQEPNRKMSKSRPGPGTILLTDAPASAAKKITRAVTDSLATIAYNPQEQPGLANLIDIFASLQNQTPQQVVQQFQGQQYGALKTATAEAVASKLEKLQTAYNTYINDKAELQNLLQKGAEKAAQVAEKTLQATKQKVGYVLP
ncbi:MAG: tryptophan--tRNA ligase [Proteobacteria bacterium]|nr:tryptophan--tRNA ligase [Pseudomonadota bacterium]